MPVVSRENVTMQVDQLHPYPRNARTHSDYQIKQLADFIKQVGYIDPIIIDETDMILAGHGRALAAMRADIHSVPCVRIAGLTESEKRAYIIADNKLALNAGWDYELLKLELDDLLTIGDMDLNIVGFSEQEIKFINDEWDVNFSDRVDKIDANTDGILVTLKVECKQEDREVILNRLKEVIKGDNLAASIK